MVSVELPTHTNVMHVPGATGGDERDVIEGVGLSGTLGPPDLDLTAHSGIVSADESCRPRGAPVGVRIRTWLTVCGAGC